tara:strand:- start:79 stop:348 length:270 start_codon:yes stop_codon:yes gene_type:complete
MDAVAWARTNLDEAKALLSGRTRTPTDDPIVNKVINKMVDRSDEGMLKYGHTAEQCKKPTAKWIDEAIEELLDACIYLERLKLSLKTGE